MSCPHVILYGMVSEMARRAQLLMEHAQVYRDLNTPTYAATLRRLIEDPAHVFPLPMHPNLERLGYAERCEGGWRLTLEEQCFLKARGRITDD